MYRKRYILLILFSIHLWTLKTTAQSNMVYRHYFLHQTLINPAIAGSEFVPVANLSFQKQWLGIPQSPYSMVASSSVRIGNFNFYTPKQFVNRTGLRTRERIGLGLTIFSDRNGPVMQRGINMAYAYHLVVKNARLSLGLAGNLEQYQLDESIFQSTFPDDPILGNRKESFLQYNANVGAYYYSAGLFAGLAINHLLPLDSRIHPGTSVKQDFILHGGYLFRSLGQPRLELSVNFRYLDYEQFDYDFHIKLYIQELNWLALSVKSYQALAMHAGMNIRNFHIAYVYEANLSNIIRYNLGTHGLHIGKNLGIRRTKGFSQ